MNPSGNRLTECAQVLRQGFCGDRTLICLRDQGVWCNVKLHGCAHEYVEIDSFACVKETQTHTYRST